MLYSLLKLITGYVDIVIEGYFIERFINICASKKIKLWNIDRKKSTILCASTDKIGFKKLRQVTKITKCRIKIRKKKGLPFIFNRYKKRKVFLIGLSLVVTVILFLSTFVWNIEITRKNEIR